MNKKAKIIISWALVIICMAVIFSLSAQTAGESSEVSGQLIFMMKLNISQDFIRTVAHFLEYTGLAVLIFNALYQTFGYQRPFVALIVSSLYAVSDEIHQLFVEGRAFQISDIVIDSLGAAGGITVLILLIKLVSKIKGGGYVDKQ
jgi:VanZ family protein